MKRVACRWSVAGAVFVLQGCALLPGPAVGEMIIRAEGDAAPVACVVPGNGSPRPGDRIYAERALRPVPAVPSARRRTASASGELEAPVGADCWTYTAGVGRFVPGQRARIHRGG